MKRALLAALLSASLVPLPAADRHTPRDFQARRGLVVAAHPLAAEAGRDMLKAGGNAVDAAVAAAFALNVVEPFASGLGGGGFMVVYLAAQKKTTVISFREKAPAAATPSMFAERGEAAEEWKSERGTAVAVPGMLAGWDLALRTYGTRSLAQTAARAIELAEKGFPVSPTFSAINKDEYEKLLKNAGEESVYLNQGLPYEPGDVFRNPDLARTLRTIAEKGAREFYRGELADRIAAAVRAHDGLMTVDDLAAYQAREVEPLRGGYRGLEIATVPPPAAGGLHVLQLLRIMEAWPVRKWGPGSVASLHHLSEAMRFIFAGHGRTMGDPEAVSIPMDELLSADYAAGIAARIRPDRTAGAYPVTASDPAKDRRENTTHLAVVDKDGNIVALTQSINDFFGSGIVPEGTGFLLNDHMRDFDTDPASPNAPGPGRRPVSSMAPLIVFRDGRPWLALGSPGGLRIFPTLVQIISNIVDHGMGLDEAIEAPRFFSSSGEGKAKPLAIESRFPEAVRKGLEALGHKLDVKEAYDKYFGGAQGLMLPARGKRLWGGADSRRDGSGAGY
ncbi:MAG: gamma-glutamyltransferase [Acidobacteriota bacterium]|nr:gamma-glutamyltransferase [Acidobacteriota bacterium]